MAITEDWAVKHANVEYSNNVTATLRAMPGLHKLAGSTASYSGNSKAKIENRFGRLRMREKSARNGDTNNTDISSLTRWIKPRRMGTVAPLVDIEDQVQTEVELGSPLVKEVAEAAMVYHDDSFVMGLFGNAYEGDGGDTIVPFKSANVVAHGGTGLTLDKLLAVRELAGLNNARTGREAPILLLTPKDETDLLQIAEYKNADFNESRPLVDGEIKPFMGMRFFSINPDEESFPDSWENFFADSGVTRRLPMFYPRGMHFGSWIPFIGSNDARPDKDMAEQYWGAAKSAAVRTDEDLVYIVETR
ncbi:MAG: phage capsid protein [Leptolyngbyaceae bacterium]|nr:phage capsid protein [Leptolyngbyaceae bacterium]